MSGRWARSPSQITAYERCPKAFEFRYVRKFNLTSVWAIRGRAAHKALGASYGDKITSGADWPVARVVELFHEEVRQGFAPMAREEVVLFEGESEDRIHAEGEASLRVYLDRVAPGIQPLLVEEPLELVRPSGLRIRGILDLVDDAMQIRDTKFPADKMDGATLHYQNQPPVYGALLHDKTGAWPRVIFDVVRIGRAKTPKPEAQPPLTLQVTPALAEARLQDIETIDTLIQAGAFPRRPSEMNCNKCVYKHACWFGMLPPAPEAPDLTPTLQASLELAATA